MKLSEYLLLRGTKANALTKKEAREIGIKLEKGWAKRHADVEVPDYLVAVVDRISPARRLETGAAKPTLQRVAPQPEGGAPRIHQRHKLAATRYLQERGRLVELGNVTARFDVLERELRALLQDSPGFIEKYGRVQYGMHQLMIDFFDDAEPTQDEYQAAAKAARRQVHAQKREKIKVAKAVRQAKSNSQVAAEIKAHRAKTQRQPAPVYRVPSGSLKVEGVDVSSKDFLSTYAWRNLRVKALNLYGRKCMCCGDTPENGAVMNVDHIKPRKRYPELALDIRWLQILCGACNHGKGNEQESDYRSPEQVAAAKSAALVM